jgi:hypothetical protein
MAHHRLDHSQQAKESLATARGLMKRMPKLNDARLRADWADWLRFQILLLEAERLVDGKAADSKADANTAKSHDTK